MGKIPESMPSLPNSLGTSSKNTLVTGTRHCCSGQLFMESVSDDTDLGLSLAAPIWGLCNERY